MNGWQGLKAEWMEGWRKGREGESKERSVKKRLPKMYQQTKIKSDKHLMIKAR